MLLALLAKTSHYIFQKKNYLSATYHKKKPFECNNVKWIKADLTDKTSVKSLFENVDVVIQTATTSGAKDIIERLTFTFLTTQL